MKRKLLALLLAAVMILSLAACGDKKDDVQDENPPVEETKDYSGYTIRIYSNSNSTERTTWLINEA